MGCSASTVQRWSGVEAAVEPCGNRAHSEAVERCALLTAEHQRSLLRIADEAAYKEGLKWQERLAATEARVRDAQARAETLAAELADVQNVAPGVFMEWLLSYRGTLTDICRFLAAENAAARHPYEAMASLWWHP
eukprot:1138987-Pelagomonas_calceolata.AAC.11